MRVFITVFNLFLNVPNKNFAIKCNFALMIFVTVRLLRTFGAASESRSLRFASYFHTFILGRMGQTGSQLEDMVNSSNCKSAM